MNKIDIQTYKQTKNGYCHLLKKKFHAMINVLFQYFIRLLVSKFYSFHERNHTLKGSFTVSSS